MPLFSQLGAFFSSIFGVFSSTGLLVARSSSRFATSAGVGEGLAETVVAIVSGGGETFGASPSLLTIVCSIASSLSDNFVPPFLRNFAMRTTMSNPKMSDARKMPIRSITDPVMPKKPPSSRMTGVSVSSGSVSVGSEEVELPCPSMINSSSYTATSCPSARLRTRSLIIYEPASAYVCTGLGSRLSCPSPNSQ